MTTTTKTSTNAAREFFRCPDCGTATLKSAPEIRILVGTDVDQKPIYKIDPRRVYTTGSGLCRVCDARRLRQAVSPRTDWVHDRESKREQAHEAATIESMGLEASAYFDEEGKPIPLADLAAFDYFYDADGCTLTQADLGSKSSTTKTCRGKALEAAADRILAEADAAAESLAALIELGKTDPVQAVMNKARTALGIPLRFAKEVHKPASTRQTEALTKKLGYDASLIRSARLSLPESSRLMQRGPAWMQKKA